MKGIDRMNDTTISIIIYASITLLYWGHTFFMVREYRHIKKLNRLYIERIESLEKSRGLMYEIAIDLSRQIDKLKRKNNRIKLIYSRLKERRRGR